MTRKDHTWHRKPLSSGVTNDTAGSVEITDERRDELASEVVDRFSLWSGAAGLIPVPIADMAAVGGVQLLMLRRLSEIYGVPFIEESRQVDHCQPGRIGPPGEHRDERSDDDR